MNNEKIRYWVKDDCLHAEWGEMALDDSDRNSGKLIEVSTPCVADNDELTRKCARTLLCAAYDEWIRLTR